MMIAFFLVLVALTPLEFSIYILAVCAFWDLMALGVANNVLTDGSSDEDLTDWE